MKTVAEARWAWFGKVMLVCFLALFLFSYDLEACLGVLVLGLVETVDNYVDSYNP